MYSALRDAEKEESWRRERTPDKGKEGSYTVVGTTPGPKKKKNGKTIKGAEYMRQEGKGGTVPQCKGKRPLGGMGKEKIGPENQKKKEKQVKTTESKGAPLEKREKVC